jgi:hypothetical protein
MFINTFYRDALGYGVLQDCSGYLQHLADILAAHIATSPLTEKGRKNCFPVVVIFSELKDPASKSTHGTFECFPICLMVDTHFFHLFFWLSSFSMALSADTSMLAGVVLGRHTRVPPLFFLKNVMSLSLN